MHHNLVWAMLCPRLHEIESMYHQIWEQLLSCCYQIIEGSSGYSPDLVIYRVAALAHSLQLFCILFLFLFELPILLMYGLIVLACGVVCSFNLQNNIFHHNSVHETKINQWQHYICWWYNAVAVSWNEETETLQRDIGRMCEWERFGKWNVRCKKYEIIHLK